MPVISYLAKESMAASKKLDSCSPIPSRLTNHYSRNSETSNPMRRSFNVSPFVKPSIISNQKGGGGCFNPNTPVNTPSGLISFLFFFWVGFCFYSYLKIPFRVLFLFMVWLVYTKMRGSKGKDRRSLHWVLAWMGFWYNDGLIFC